MSAISCVLLHMNPSHEDSEATVSSKRWQNKDITMQCTAQHSTAQQGPYYLLEMGCTMHRSDSIHLCVGKDIPKKYCLLHVSGQLDEHRRICCMGISSMYFTTPACRIGQSVQCMNTAGQQLHCIPIPKPLSSESSLGS